MFILESSLCELWATKGVETGRKADAVGDNFCSNLKALELEVKGSFSAADDPGV